MCSIFGTVKYHTLGRWNENNLLLLLLLSHFSRVRLCVTPYHCSPPGSPIPGILQARTLERVVISFANARKWKVKVKSLSHVWLLETHGLQPTRLLHLWGFPSKSTGVECHCLLQKIIYVFLNELKFFF